MFEAPKKISLNPYHQSVSTGETVYFSCHLDANVEWTFNGGPLPLHVVQGKLDNQDYYIEIIHANKQDEGQYKCSGRLGEDYIWAIGTLKIESKGKYWYLLLLYILYTS